MDSVKERLFVSTLDRVMIRVVNGIAIEATILDISKTSDIESLPDWLSSIS